jgi:ribulose-phosphate 3-epimerase
MVEIIPTCVPAEAADLSSGADAIRSFADAIHIDIVDGLFAPAYTWPYSEKGVFGAFDLSGAGELLKEVHLMVAEPRAIGIAFAKAGAFRIIGHVEAFSSTDEAHSTLAEWKKSGASEVGLGILMDTPFELLEHHLLIVDVVHMMSISSIGTQGIPYNPAAPARIFEFHKKHPEVLISVDGGVSSTNIADLVRAGVSRFGIGSAIAKAADPRRAYHELKSAAEGALQ